MKLRTKLLFVYAGATGAFAFLFACLGNPLCFLFLGLAAFDWYTGQRLMAEELNNRGEN